MVSDITDDAMADYEWQLCNNVANHAFDGIFGAVLKDDSIVLTYYAYIAGENREYDSVIRRSDSWEHAKEDIVEFLASHEIDESDIAFTNNGSSANLHYPRKVITSSSRNFPAFGEPYPDWVFEKLAAYPHRQPDVVVPEDDDL